MSDVLTPQVPSAPAPTTPLAPPTNLAAPSAPAPPPPAPKGNLWRTGGVPDPAPTPTSAPAVTPAAAFTAGRPPAPAQTQLTPVWPRPGAAPAPAAAPPPASPRPGGWSLPLRVPTADDVRRVAPWLYEAGADAVAGSPTVPPLIGAGVTADLPEAIRGPAEGVLRFAQRNFQDNPGLFAQVVGGLGKPLIAPLLGTPAGMPLMAGLYGMLTGGESGHAARRFFAPVIDRFNAPPDQPR